MKSLLKSILGGVAISIGGIIYLSLDNHIVGAFLFSIGLFSIYTFNLNLFTGKVCYIPNKSPMFLLDVLLVLIGNAIGTVSLGFIIRETKLKSLINYTTVLVDKKLDDTIFSTFIMAILCGLMMCIAVMGFTTIKDSVGKHFALVLPIMVFILAGFEHSVADLFYFSFANVWSPKALLYIIVIALGNLVGGIILPLTVRYTDGKKLGID